MVQTIFVFLMALSPDLRPRMLQPELPRGIGTQHPPRHAAVFSSEKLRLHSGIPEHRRSLSVERKRSAKRARH